MKLTLYILSFFLASTGHMAAQRVWRGDIGQQPAKPSIALAFEVSGIASFLVLIGGLIAGFFWFSWWIPLTAMIGCLLGVPILIGITGTGIYLTAFGILITLIAGPLSVLLLLSTAFAE